MAEKLGSKETVDFEKLLIPEVTQSKVLVNFLEKKGIITKRGCWKRLGG
jgi:hypothetical protein